MIGKNCPHGVERYHCVKCKGVDICVHNRQKYHCVKCKGVGICVHNRQKYHCVKCKGNGICKHNKRKYRCKDCKLEIDMNRFYVLKMAVYFARIDFYKKNIEY